jgi:TolB-like protein/Flp pilus assembly protein TadD
MPMPICVDEQYSRAGSFVAARVALFDRPDARMPDLHRNDTIARSAIAGSSEGASQTELSYAKFVAALKGALRDYNRPDLLARNPLLRSHLFRTNDQAGATDLQALLSKTADQLFASPRDEKLRRVIELTYFRPAPKQEAAADRLGLAFGTYRRHLTTSLTRLAAWLWDRERAEACHEGAAAFDTKNSQPGVEQPFASLGPNAAGLTIVVLPFVNLGGDKDDEYFVDGITESLTTDLSRMLGAFVIARNTAFTYKNKATDARQIGAELGVRYVMEGSMQLRANRIRINAQLIDAETGAHLWAERFDQDRGDPFETQDMIVTRLARALDVELPAAEARRVERSVTRDLSSLDLFYRGWAAFNRGHNPDNLLEAERLIEQALKLEPDNVEALVGFAMTKYASAATYATGERAAHLFDAEAAATRALTLAPNHARAHAALGFVYITGNRAVLGIKESERAIALDRNLAPCHAAIGWAKARLGRAHETEAHIIQAFLLSPQDSLAYSWCHIAGMAKFGLGRCHQATAWFRRAIEANRSYPPAYFSLAAALARCGLISDAREAVAAGLALCPDFTIRRFRTGVVGDNPTYLVQSEQISEEMRKAGVPEG